MFGDLNRVDLIGNITQDLTVRYTGNGKAVLSFSVATNRRYKPAPDQDWKDEATFHNIVVWGDQAEGLAKRARKGTRLFISGRLQNRNWQDNDGKTNYKTEVIVEKMILLDRYEKGPASEFPAANITESPKTGGSSFAKNSTAKKASAKPEPSAGDTTIDPDDLPF